ncbi:MAG: SulP family inorganic anion transporter [Candidatus Electrothrix aestuarii]|uniref:SulP family inorganic anion transporter n=1 Tax=Candidatus Electrothrix aestuarii TaxID=3062594 RepID=A0AAU8LSG1_9BACT|nr:SulP family inorganic anion transporter [Candidatus Electrothrix aestuarii]
MIFKFFPFLLWFKGYKPEMFKMDLVAGITVALVLIPQSMAYAQLAGLPAYYGLYAAFLPPMVAALFGSSRQLGTGPVAVVSLMSAASLESLATAGSQEFITYSIMLALVVGLFQFALGVLRLGMVVNFLSHPVINGFTNAAAIIIASSQFSKFFGVYVDKAPHHYQTMVRVVQAACDYTHWPTLLYGIAAILIMVASKRKNPRIPAVLLAVAITTLLSWATGFNQDALVPLSNIHSPGIQKKIDRFNEVVSEVSHHGRERTDLGKAAEELHKAELEAHGAPPPIELLQIENKVAILSRKMDHAKHDAHLIRTELRRMKFEGIKHENQYTFYAREAIPPGVKTDGRTWRIKLGNSPLDTEKIILTSGGAVVGDVPEGIPSLNMPEINLKAVTKLLPTAIIISLLGFMEAIAIAKAMAAKTGQQIDANQELIGQGLANILGSAGQSYAVSGSFSRSAVNLQAGAVTGISSVVTSMMVLLTLMFFTPLLYHLPQATLAAVIMMAVIGLINTSGFIHAWKAQRYDGIISVITFLVTLYAAPHLDQGILVGFALSMGVFLYKSMRPVVAELSMNEEKILKSSEHYRLKGCRHISVVRFDGALFFANASYLDEQVGRFRNEHPNLRAILLDARGINDMDASGEEVLAMIVQRLRAAGLSFAMSSVKGQVMAVMERTHLLDKIGREHIYPDTKTAVASLTEEIHRDSDLPKDCCPDCPLTHYIPAP